MMPELEEWFERSWREYEKDQDRHCINYIFQLVDGGGDITPSGPVFKRVKHVETDPGLVIVWRTSKREYRRLLGTDPNTILEQGPDTMPRGHAKRVNTFFDALEARLRGDEERGQSLIDRWLEVEGPIAREARTRVAEQAQKAVRKRRRGRS